MTPGCNSRLSVERMFPIRRPPIKIAGRLRCTDLVRPVQETTGLFRGMKAIRVNMGCS